MKSTLLLLLSLVVCVVSAGCRLASDPDRRDAASCDDGGAACGGRCVDLSSDTSHCGGCNNACPSNAGSTVACIDGRCSFTCLAEYSDCDARPTNACEAHLPSDTSNCGRCGQVCPGRPNAAPRCLAGSCTIVCREGFGDCNGNREDGCERDVRADVDHCGGCGVRCESVPNARVDCVSSSCRVICDPGRADCNGRSSDGCETQLGSDASHCGTCGNACPAAPNATPVCASGMCSIRCSTGFADCNLDRTDGCESIGACT